MTINVCQLILFLAVVVCLVVAVLVMLYRAIFALTGGDASRYASGYQPVEYTLTEGKNKSPIKGQDKHISIRIKANPPKGGSGIQRPGSPPPLTPAFMVGGGSALITADCVGRHKAYCQRCRRAVRRRHRLRVDVKRRLYDH